MMPSLMQLALLAAVAAVCTAAPKPNIFMVIVDDFGWANVGWHRDTPTPEVQVGF